jgi:TatD DNase family protein
MVRPRWVDFHCHLDLYADHVSLIAECDREKVATLAVTTTPKAWRRNEELAKTSDFVRVALGLHPQLVAERADELGLFEQLLPHSRYVGEVGLDAGPRFYASFADQERVFSRVLDACSEQGNKILTVHSVRSVAKVLDHLERRLLPKRGRAILHWFTGTAAEAKRAADYFSINAEMLRTEKHRRLVRTLPTDRLLTETDGPFVAFGDRPARPTDVKHATELLAETLDTPRAHVESLVIKNLGELARFGSS